MSEYLGLLMQIENYLQVVHAYESHQITIDSYFTRVNLILYKVLSQLQFYKWYSLTKTLHNCLYL